MKTKRIFRSISIMLSMLMVFMTFPAGAYALSEDEIAQVAEETVDTEDVTAEAEAEPDELTAVGEETALRGASTKHFRMSDGSYTAVTYGSAVHYESDGEWVDIDNTLSDQSAEDSDDIDGFAPKSNDTKVKFAKKSNSSKILTLKYGDARISFSLNGEKNKVSSVTSKPEFPEDDPYALPDLSSRVTYADIFDGIDLVYDMHGMNVKESFVLHSDTGVYDFSFDLKVKGVTPSLDDEGNIIFTADSGEEAFMIPKGFMYDAEGARSENVAYSLSGSGKKYTLTITADEEWISADERSFPVTIDPTIVNLKYDYVKGQSITTQYYNLNDNSIKTDTGDLYIGISSGVGEYTGRIKITALPELPENTVMTKAHLLIMQNGYSDVSLSSLEISAYRATSDTTWYSSYNNTVIDYIHNDKKHNNIDVYQEYTEPHLIDITAAYQEWLSGTPNYGITFVGTNMDWEGKTYANTRWVGCASASSSNASAQPRLILSYRNTVGVEGLYTYESYSAGRAGNVYVAHNSGQVTVEVPLLTTSSDTHPYTLSAIYNTHHSEQYFTYAEDDIHTSRWYTRLGHGWKLSVQQSVYPKELHSAIDGTAENYLIHTDSDGTEHYYKQDGEDSSRYNSEEGSKLYIEANASGWYYLRDEEGAFSSFDESGYIRGTADKNGNKHYYTYTTISGSQKRLDTIYRQNLGMTAVKVAEFGYSGQKITSVTDEFGGVTTFTYTSNKITSITRPDGTGTTVNYGGSNTNYKIWKLYDNETSYGLQFTYSTGAGIPLSNIREYCYDGGSLYYGAQNIFAYNSSDRTTVTYCGGNGIKDTDASAKDDMQYITLFDHYGRTVCAYTYDPFGRKVYSTGSVVYAEHSGETSKMKNKVTEAGSSGVNNANMLTNAGFEGGSTLPTGWYKSPVTPSSSTVALTTAEHYTGSQSLKVTAASASSSETQAYMTVSGLTAGLTYTFSAYIKASGITGTGGAYVKGGGTLSRYYQSTSSSLDNGWQKISVTFTPTSSTENICCGIVNSAGTAYFDNVQLERHPSPSMTSLVSNGGAEKDGGWSFEGGGYSSAYYNSGARSVYVDGSPSAKRYALQSIAVNRPATATYVVSGWGRANSAPLAADHKLHAPTYGFLVRIVYSDNTTEDHAVSFNSDITSWQFVSSPIVPKQRTKTVSRIDLFLSYDYNVNTARFDDICLAIETCTAYEYNDKGEVIAVNHTEQSGVDAEYNSAGNPTEIVDEATGTYTYTYDGAQNLLTSAWDGITTEYQYNSGKLNTYTQVIAGGGKMWTSAAYNSTNDHLISTTDTTGRTVNYGYSIDTEADVFKRTTQDAILAAAGANINELYDSVTGRTLLLNRQDGDVYFAYENGSVSTVTPIANAEGSTNRDVLTDAEAKASASGAVSGYQYKYSYDKWGNLTKVEVGGKTLKDSAYDDITGELLTSLLPFGDKLNYAYDICGRVTEITDDDGNVLVKYTYDGQGNISKITDNVGYLISEYGYDSIGRLLYQTGYSWGTNRDRSNSYSYDGYGRLSRSTFTYGSLSGYESYAYNSSGLVSKKVAGNGDIINVNYDGFNRINSREIETGTKDAAERYEYYLAHTNTCHTLLPKRVIYSVNGTEVTSAGAVYDSSYNVTELQRYSATEATFTYDSANRLMTESYPDGDAVAYYYDERGNITSKTVKENGVIRTVEYGYGGTQADALKSYDGESFTYNAYGYPTAYYNGSEYTFSWDKYGNLTGSTKDGVAQFYTYDIGGQRKTKTAGGVTSTYYYDGNTLMAQINSDGTSLLFNYDESGNPIGFTRTVNGTPYNYYYVRNLQGDIIRILDADFAIVCNYYYDAWGAIRQITDKSGNDITGSTDKYSIAYINPIRYRGYYYDVETGLYYLQTRYYDPEIGRFISRDSYEFIGANGDLGSYNLFAYCSNNPLKHVDPSGQFWEDVVLEIINAVADCAFQSFKSASEAALSIAEKQSSASYMGGGVFIQIPNGLGTALTAYGNTMSSISKIAKKLGSITNGIGIVIELIGNFSDNSLELSRKITDSAVDIGVSVGTIFAAGKAGAYMGTVVSPIVGTISGMFVGVTVSAIGEYTPIIDWAKDGVDWTVNSVGDCVKYGAKCARDIVCGIANDVMSILS